MFEKNKNYSFSRFEGFEQQNIFVFVSSFENVNSEINGKYSKNNYDNPNYYVSLVIFQTYKMYFKKMSTHLGGSFDYVFIL
jgi:hypothetical protein